MNKARRKELEAISSKTAELRDEVTCVGEQEQEAYDNLPEGIQESERGASMEENVSELEEIASEFDGLMERIDEIINK